MTFLKNFQNSKTWTNFEEKVREFHKEIGKENWVCKFGLPCPSKTELPDLSLQGDNTRFENLQEMIKFHLL